MARGDARLTLTSREPIPRIGGRCDKSPSVGIPVLNNQRLHSAFQGLLAAAIAGLLVLGTVPANAGGLIVYEIGSADVGLASAG